MSLLIMSQRQAVYHLPAVPTTALRIFDSYPGSLKLPLVDSPFYSVQEYVFDDQDLDSLQTYYPHLDFAFLARQHVFFDDELAQKILVDFDKLRGSCIDLLVHCTLGGGRSPAVALALNDIFNLGYNSEEIKKKYQAYNPFVYRLLMENSS